MNIGIIGAGHIGGTLTRRLTKLGHRVFVANSRGPQTLADLTRETGAEAVTPEQAARKGEVVIVAIALKNLPKLPRGLFKGVDRGALQFAGRCGSCSTGTAGCGAGGAAWRARNSKQEAAAFYNGAGATTVAG